jgi:hypothetical protein
MGGPFIMQQSRLNIETTYNSKLLERAYIQNFNSILNKFNAIFVEQNVEELYNILDEFKPYIYGQFNLEIISMLKRMNYLIITKEQYLPKYYFFCGQAYHYLNEQEESKKYFRLAISYGMKYKQYRIVSYSIWNSEIASFKDKNISHADQLSRLVAIFYNMDESLHDDYNRSLLAHFSAAHRFNQLDYVEHLVQKVEPIIPKYCKDWVDLMVLKASVFRQRKQFIQAFEILSELYPRLNKRIVKAKTIPNILQEIRLLSEHFYEINETTQVKNQLLKGYLEFIKKNKGFTYEIEQIQSSEFPFVIEKNIFIEKAEKILSKENNSLFICIDLKTNIVPKNILKHVQLKALNEIYTSLSQKTIVSCVLSDETLVMILENEDHIEMRLEKILSLVKEQQLSMVASELFHFTVLSNRKYEVYNYNDAQNLANAFFYYELCKRV